MDTTVFEQNLDSIAEGFDDADRENLRQLLNPESVHGAKAEGMCLQCPKFRQSIERVILGEVPGWGFGSYRAADYAVCLSDAQMVRQCSLTDRVQAFGEILLNGMVPLTVGGVFVLLSKVQTTSHERN